jgi:LAO/AO transport system kinase
MSLDELVARALSGDHRSLARVATILESRSEQASDVRRLLGGTSSSARTVGITGPPGVGKSSVLANLAARLASCGRSVAIVAVDPTSPLTGGATLGDRIRMSEPSLLPNVFVRSLASRTRLDGLAPAALDMLRLFGAAGFDYVFLETVGSGQNQVEIARLVQTLVLVEAPGAGDSVQMLKAGIMELADIYAVNKSDLPGAHLVSRELRAMVSLGDESPGVWRPRIVLCSNETGEGFDILIQAIDAHGQHLEQSGHIREHAIELARAETLDAAMGILENHLANNRELVAAVADGKHSPEFAARQLLEAIRQSAPAGT